MSVRQIIENLLRYICEETQRQLAIELQRFTEPLAAWVNELLSRQLPPDWRQRMHAYLDAWDAEFNVAPEHRPILENWIESWAIARGLMPSEQSDLSSLEISVLIEPPTITLSDADFNKLAATASPYLGLDATPYAVSELEAAARRAEWDQVSRALEAQDPDFDPFQTPKLPDLLDASDYRRDQIQRVGDSVFWSFVTELNAAIHRFIGLEERHPELESPGQEQANDWADFAGDVAILATMTAVAGAPRPKSPGGAPAPPVSLAEEAAAALRKVVEEELDRLSANPSLAETVLSAKQIAANVNPAVARMNYGKALEQLVGRRVASDPVLRTHFEYHGRGPGPDFVGIGRYEGVILDLTTPGQVARHLARPDGEGLTIVEYSRPAALPAD